MKLNGTRTFLELHVGAYHAVEVILLVSKEQDIGWFNDDSSECFQHLLDLLTNSIIPRICGDELELFYHRKFPHRFPIQDIGCKNIIAKATNAANRKRKRKLLTKKQLVAAQKTALTTAAAATAATANQEENTDEKKTKDIYYAFGQDIPFYVAYKVEEDINPYQGATLLFSSSSGNDTISSSGKIRNGDGDSNRDNQTKTVGNAGGFRQLIKLSKRLMIWIKRTDDHNNANTSSSVADDDTEILQPECVPLDRLFRP